VNTAEGAPVAGAQAALLGGDDRCDITSDYRAGGTVGLVGGNVVIHSNLNGPASFTLHRQLTATAASTTATGQAATVTSVNDNASG
jgi:hypothetical protein